MSPSRPTLLVTGACGFVGKAVAQRLDRDGRRVRRAVRARSPTDPPDTIAGDLGAGSDWASRLEDVDCVVHCAARAHVLRDAAPDPLAQFRAINRDATLRLANAAASAGVRRFVFISSIGVNGGSTEGIPFTARDTPQPRSAYAVAKWEAEQGLAEIAARTGLELVVIRPPLVIGSGAKGNIGTIAGLLKKGIPVPLGAVTRNRRDLVSLPNLVDLIAVCIDHPAAAGRTLLVSDGFPRSSAAIVRAVAAAEDVTPRLLRVPEPLIAAALTMLGKARIRDQLLGDLEVDIGATCRALGWHPSAAAAYGT